MSLFQRRVAEYQLEKDHTKAAWLIHACTLLCVFCGVCGFIPGYGGWCRADWVYPKSYFILMFTHFIIFCISTYLWYKEYFMQEEFVLNATFSLSK